jgi:non-homologous end joining protein Ku
VKDPAEFEREVTAVEVAPEELAVAKTLSSAMSAGEFDLAAYADRYKQNVRNLVESKVKGQKVIAPPPVRASTT